MTFGLVCCHHLASNPDTKLLAESRESLTVTKTFGLVWYYTVCAVFKIFWCMYKKQIERLNVTLTMLKLNSTGHLTVFMQKVLQETQNWLL